MAEQAAERHSSVSREPPFAEDAAPAPPALAAVQGTLAICDAPQLPPNDVRRQTMRSWTVAHTAAFLRRRDLPSAARVLEASDTNGVELFDMELDTLVDDLRVSRFHARRVLAARDAFLYGSAK